MKKLTEEKVSYNTEQLIHDLREELRLQSEALARIFPRRVKGYKDYWLSRLWGYSKKYVNTLKNTLKIDSNKVVAEVALVKLEDNLVERLGIKAWGCKGIIKSYRDGKISSLQFLDKLSDELGRVNGEIPVTLEEASQTLVGSSRFISAVSEKIRGADPKHYYPNYKFNLERLGQFRDYLSTILGEKAQNCLDLINKYESKNLDLKRYKNAQYNVRNPDYFNKLNQDDKLYWFGFLCADGWLLDGYRIGLEISKKDQDLLEKYLESIGLPHDRIKERIRFTRTKSGKVTASDMVRVIFGCKDMYNDLENNGFRFIKGDPNLKKLPPIVYNLIKDAKIESSANRFIIEDIQSIPSSIRWYYTASGRLALSWLLGFYDGDGHYSGGRRASLCSNSFTLMKGIEKAFMTRNPAHEYENMSFITLGPELFDAMIWSFGDSMPRKRPIPDRDNNGYIGKSKKNFNLYLYF